MILSRFIPVMRARVLQGLVAGPFLMLPMFSLEEKLYFVAALAVIILLGAWGTYQGARFAVEPAGIRPMNTGGQHFFCAWESITKVSRPYGFLSPEFCVYYEMEKVPYRLTLWVLGREKEFCEAVRQYAPAGNPLRRFVDERFH